MNNKNLGQGKAFGSRLLLRKNDFFKEILSYMYVYMHLTGSILRKKFLIDIWHIS